MERSKQMYLSHYRSLSKSLERATADRIMQARAWRARAWRAGSCGGVQLACARASPPSRAPAPPAAPQAMTGPDRRFRDPSPEEVGALTLEGMLDAVMAQLHAGNLEVRARRAAPSCAAPACETPAGVAPPACAAPTNLPQHSSPCAPSPPSPPLAAGVPGG